MPVKKKKTKKTPGRQTATSKSKKKSAKTSKKISLERVTQRIKEDSLILDPLITTEKPETTLEKPIEGGLKEKTSPLSGPKIITDFYSPSPTKKSPHLVNLKNPSVQDPFSQAIRAQVPRSVRLIKENRLPPKPPKNLYSRTQKTGVDFINGENLISQLSLISLLQFIFKPFIKIFGFQPKTKNYAPEPQVELTQTTISLAENNQDQSEAIEDIFAPVPKRKSGGFSLPQNWYKPVGAFVLTCLLLILPFQAFSYYQYLQETKDNVLILTNDAINQLKEGQKYAISFELNSASQEFDQARQKFALAQNEISQINALTTEILKLIPGQGETVEAGLNLLESGEILAEVGQILTKAGNDFLNQSGDDYYVALEKLGTNLETGVNKFYEAKAIINRVDGNDLTPDHRVTFNQVLQTLPIIENSLTDLYTLNSAILKVLGQKQWQRYLLIFANNNELRGSGGFMGSFALLDIDRGNLKNLEVPSGGTYDVQGQLTPKVISPEPIHLINSRWEFQDANWWPDFPTTAQKIQWFYQNSWGASTDGVILITATMMSHLLSVLGPIEMPEYELTVTSDNFINTTQQIIREEREKESQAPKQIITDLAPKLLEKIFNLKGEEFKNLISVLQKGLNEKQLLIFFNDDWVENIILSLDWGGRIKETNGDFLSVVHTNLAGGKTDEVIAETIEHQVEVLDDGSIIDTIKLTRTHNGPKDGNVFTGVQNNSYVRFYVPSGSILIEAIGFEKPDKKYFDQPVEDLVPDIDLLNLETDRQFDQNSGTDIYKERDKTVFGNWLQLKPGETKQATIKYRLPFKLAQEGENTFYYSLLAQKQSGSRGSKLISTLKLNDSLKALAKYPLYLEEQNEGKIIKFSSQLTTDQFYGVALITK